MNYQKEYEQPGSLPYIKEASGNAIKEASGNAGAGGDTNKAELTYHRPLKQLSK